MTAEIIATALGGRKTGRCWMARCPAHDDREPSLSIATGKDGKVLLRCHAGCDQAQVIDALWGRGLWEPRDRHADRRRAYKLRRSAVMAPERDDAKRTEAALRIWRVSAPAPGTLIETYLQSRGLHPPLPPTLRFHTGLKHPSGGIWPAMVTLVTRGGDDTQFAIHRTFLTRDGTGKIPVEPQKMMLGPCRGKAGPVGRTPGGRRGDRDGLEHHAGHGCANMGSLVGRWDQEPDPSALAAGHHGDDHRRPRRRGAQGSARRSGTLDLGK